jgi:DNA-binding transcriptional LysR family regulator
VIQLDRPIDNRVISSLVWRWLPVFRTVAETQSISQASQALGVSPPAISRALRQIEEAIGRDLFDRKGRQLVLNPNGERLLEAVREMELRLESVLDRLADHDAAGAVRLGAIGQLGRVFLLPAIRALTEQYPRLQLSIVHLEPEVAIERLKGGMLDLFLALNVAVGEPLTSAHLAELALAVYAGRGHPLFGVAPVAPDTLEQHGFVAQRRPGLMRSIWPSTLKRTVTLETDSHAIALDACLGGSHLMVMERVVSAPLVASGQLCEVASDLLEPARLVLVRHAHSPNQSLLDKVALAIQRAVDELTASAST